MKQYNWRSKILITFQRIWAEHLYTEVKLTLCIYLLYLGNALAYHNNRMFSTTDRDNDAWGSHCVTNYKGPWWHGACYHSNLNGLYKKSKTSDSKYDVWAMWPGGSTNMKTTTMMIRGVWYVHVKCLHNNKTFWNLARFDYFQSLFHFLKDFKDNKFPRKNVIY